MAPSWVFLDRYVPFYYDPTAVKEEGNAFVGVCRPPSFDEIRDAIIGYLQTLKPDAQLVDPPNFSSLRMLPPSNAIRQRYKSVTSARISSSHKNLVALYAGSYRPGVRCDGGYLIYNAGKNSLSVIPPLPFDYCRAPLGHETAVVVSDGEGGGDGYVLAELVKAKRSSAAAEGELHLWRSSAPEWVVKTGPLPLVISETIDEFCADSCFLSEGSTLCWGDLFKGLLVCDLSPVLKYDSDPQFRFIALPPPCLPYNVNTPLDDQARAEEFRSMAYAQGAIKFVTMEGYYGNQPVEDFELTLWTLSSDLSEWNKTSEYRVANIWKNETHQALGMPKIAPSLPVLSMYENAVVYLVFSDIRVQGSKREYKGQYLLRVDMENNEVEFYPARKEWIFSQFMASDFSAYQKVSCDHPIEVEASESGAASAKRMKL